MEVALFVVVDVEPGDDPEDGSLLKTALVTSYKPSPAKIIIPIEANTSNLAKVALTYIPVIPIIRAKTDISVRCLNAIQTPSPANINRIE